MLSGGPLCVVGLTAGACTHAIAHVFPHVSAPGGTIFVTIVIAIILPGTETQFVTFFIAAFVTTHIFGPVEA